MTRLFCAIFLLLIIFSLSLSAQSQILADYHNYKSMTSALKSLAERYPDVVNLTSEGTTLGKRELWRVTLGTKAEIRKPAIAIFAGVEADDVASGEICLQFIESVAQEYGRNDSLTKILDRFHFYICPRVNPDATEQLWAPLVYERLLNERALDLDHDGAISEDGYDDLNKDGHITWMRITDPAGEWLSDPHHPQLMRKADPAQNETGIYRRLQEGFDNDNDGQFNEDPTGGVNFNQNFSFNYEPFVVGAGPHAVSEIETRAVADFLFAHKNIVAVFSFSSNENLLQPWKAKNEPLDLRSQPITQVPPQDAEYYVFLSEQFKKLTGFIDPHTAEPGAGNFNEWAYYHYGRWSFSAPAWYAPMVYIEGDSVTNEKPDPIAAERQLWRWLKANNMDAFVEWTVVDHADFPDDVVEVGGFVPGALKNPPADSLDVLADKFSEFLFYLANQLPQLDVQVEVSSLHDNLFRITARIKNIGYLPTASEIGALSQWVPEVKAELILSDNQKLVSGTRFYLINKLNGGSAVEKQWVVSDQRAGDISVFVGNPSVGFVTVETNLE